MPMLSKLVIFGLGMIPVVGTLMATEPIPKSATVVRPEITLAGTFDVVDLVLDARRFDQKVLVVRNVNIDCVDERRCFLRAPGPFDYRLTIDFSSLRMETRRDLFLGRFREITGEQLVGRLTGDVVVASEIRGETEAGGNRKMTSE